MELDETESDEWCRWSPTTSPRADGNRPPRGQSRIDGSNDALETCDTRSRGAVNGSASPCWKFGVEKYRKNNRRAFTVKHELEEGEIPRDSKRGRHSDHGCMGNFTCSLEQRHRSPKRLPQRHGTNASCEEKPIHDTCFSSRILTKDEPRKRIHHRRDKDARLVHTEHNRETSILHKYFSEGHCQNIEGYGSAPLGKPHCRLDTGPCDHKHGYNVESDNSLSRNGTRSSIEATNDADRSSKWQPNFDKNDDHMECKSSSSWDGLKLGKGTPYSNKQNSEHICTSNTGTGNTVLWNGPKWGEETRSEDAPSFINWRSDTVNDAHNKESDTNFLCTGSKWGHKTNGNNVESSRRSSPNNWDSKKTKNDSSWSGPKVDDRAASKDAPGLSRQKSDVDKWDSCVKSESKAKANGPKCDDTVAPEDGPCSIRRKSDDKWDPWVKFASRSTRSCPKWNERTQPNDAPGFSGQKSDFEKWDPWANSNSRSTWNGPKWDDKADSKDGSLSNEKSDVEKCGTLLKSDSRSTGNDPKWDGPVAPKDASGFSRQKTDDKWDPWVKSDRSTMNNPKQDGKIAPKDVPGFFGPGVDKWDPWANSLSRSTWDRPQQVDKVASKDVSLSQQKSEVDKWDPWLKSDSRSTGNWSKWDGTVAPKNAFGFSRQKTDEKGDDKTAPKVAPRFSWQKSDVDKWDPWANSNSRSTHNGPKQDDKAASKNVSLSRQKSDVDKRDPWLKSDSRSTGNDAKWDDTVAPASGFSRQKTENKWDYWVKSDSRSIMNNPKWGSKTAPKDAPAFSGQKSGAEKWNPWVESDSRATWNDPNWGDKASKDAPVLSRQKSDVDKWDPWVKSDSKSTQNGPKGDDTVAPKVSPGSYTGKADDKWDPWEKSDSKSTWNGPKWDDRTASKYAAALSQQKSGVEKWDPPVKADGISTWNGPRWNDRAASKDAPSFSNKKSDDKWDPWVKSDSKSTGNGPKWDDRAARERGDHTPKTMPHSSAWSNNDGQDNNLDTQKTPWTLKWDDRMTYKDASKSTRWRHDGNRRGFLGSTKWGDQTKTNDLENSFQHFSDGERRHYDVKADGRLSINNANGGDQTFLDDAAKSSQQGYDVETERSSQCVPSGALECVVHDASDSCDRRSDNAGPNTFAIHSMGTRDATHRRNPGRNTRQEATQEASTTRKCSNGQGVKSNHQLGSINQWSEPSANLKPFLDEASVHATTLAIPIRSSLQSCSPEPITLCSSYLKHQITVKESQTSSKGLVPLTCTNALTGDGATDASANLEGEVHPRQQESKELRVVGDALMESMGTQASQNKQELDTCHPTVADCNMRKTWQMNNEDEGILMFKCAIAEFAKDRLKPLWKEGRLSREAHKIIVKKVVDKVYSAMQGENIPRTPKNIDLYMAYSKAKLNNLVQAYLERFVTR